MWLIGVFHTMLVLAVTLWQFSGDDVRPSRHVPDKGEKKKHGLPISNL